MTTDQIYSIESDHFQNPENRTNLILKQLLNFSLALMVALFGPFYAHSSNKSKIKQTLRTSCHLVAKFGTGTSGIVRSEDAMALSITTFCKMSLGPLTFSITIRKCDCQHNDTQFLCLLSYSSLLF